MPDEQRPLGELFYGAVTLGERGQIVIPAEAREAYGLQGGDKLLVFNHPHNCGLIIARIEDVQRLIENVSEFVKTLSEPSGHSPTQTPEVH